MPLITADYSLVVLIEFYLAVQDKIQLRLQANDKRTMSFKAYIRPCTV